MKSRALENFDAKALRQDWAAIIKAPFGKLGIQTQMYEGSLMVSEIFYVAEKLPSSGPKNSLAEEVSRQITCYLEDPNYVFDVPMIPQGTPFQNRVWQCIATIPCGQTYRYGELAKHIHSAPRAVGGACAANPYPLIVPCHRVISATGIGGFAHHDEEGYHRTIKSWLLHHEGINI